MPKGFPLHPKPLADRFWEKVDKRGADECWTWTKAAHVKGYGRFFVNGKSTLAHRVAYWLATGHAPPSDLQVCHSCDNPRCVNPSHLWLGTNDDNHADKMSKGRQTRLSGERNPKAKVGARDVAVIRSSRESSSALGERYGLTRHSIANIRAGRTWNEGASR